MSLVKNKVKMIIKLFYLSAFLFGCNAGDKEAIIVPKEFKGYIVIIYNQKTGSPSQYNNGKRIYKIPQGGIYKTQLASNEGLKDIPEFYYEEMTKEKQLPSYVEFDKIPPNVVVGFMGARASANKDYEGKQTIEYSLYYVGMKEDIRKAISEAENLDVTAIVN
jgi:hypothetical protein